MADTTSVTERSRRTEENSSEAEEAEAAATTAQRDAAGASVLGRQQLRHALEQIDEEIAVRRNRISGRVRTLSRALKSAGGMLAEDDLAVQGLHFASDKVEGLAGYVDELTPSQVVDDLRGAAQNRPAWFFGGAFVLGLALGRFARSTAGALAESARPAGIMRSRGAHSTAARTGARTESNDTRGRSQSPTRREGARS